MVEWHHWLDGLGFGWTPGVGDWQGGLACCGSWGWKESDTTERLNWLAEKYCLSGCLMVYPFSYWKTSWLLPVLGSCSEHLHAGLSVEIRFQIINLDARLCGKTTFTYVETVKWLRNWLHPYACPLAVSESSHCSTSVSAFGSVSFLDVSHSNSGTVVSHCFSLLFPNDTKLSIFSCAYILSWCVFSDCFPLKNLVLLLSFKSSVYVLDKSPSSDICFTDIFSLSVVRVFIFCIFHRAEICNFNKVLFNFLFHELCIWRYI